MKKIFTYIVNHPRLSIIYGVLGALSALLLVLTVNDKNFRPVQDKAHWTAASNFSPTLAARAIDQNLKSAWSSYAPLSFGMYVRVDLQTPCVVNGLLLLVRENEQQGQPAEWIVKTSEDGVQWRDVSIRKTIPDHDAPYVMLAILFAPVHARYLQIAAAVDANSPWVINELEIFQPILPWQFERSTLLLGILGCGVLLLAILAFLPAQGWTWQNILPPVLLILAVLLGWGLRVYDLRSYELSAQEWEYDAFLDFGKAGVLQWIKGYLAYTQTGAAWLALLCNHWAEQFFFQQLVSMRIAPALFGMGIVFLIFLLYKMKFLGNGTKDGFSLPSPVMESTFRSGLHVRMRVKVPRGGHLRGGLHGEFHSLASMWEGCLAAALVSVAGFPIFLGRRGEFAVALCFLILLYLAATYHFLYRQGTSWWVLGLMLLALSGFCVDPAMGYIPLGIMLFGVVALVGAACKSQENLKNQAFRLSLYLLSLLPLYGYRGFLLKETWTAPVSFSVVSLMQVFSREFSQALQFVGFSGMGFWLLSGLAIVGGVQLCRRRNQAEWFFYGQGLLFSILVVLYSTPENISARFCLSAILVLCLIAKGIATLLALFERNVPEHSPQSVFAQTVIFIVLTGYLAFYALNSVFGGYAGFPQASAWHDAYQQQKVINPLIRQIVTDSNACKTVGVLNRRLANFYATTYNLPAYFTQSADLQQASETGEFWPYLLVPRFWQTAAQAEIAPFLKDSYAEVGKSAFVTLYQLKAEFTEQRQHYSARDLFSLTGRRIDAPQASSGKAYSAETSDPPGILAFTPSFRKCRPGRYLARFVLHSSGKTDDVAAILEVVANRYDSLGRLELKGRDFDPAAAYQSFELPFQLDLSDNPAFQVKRLQCFVNFTGKADVRVDYIELLPAPQVEYSIIQ